MRDGEPGGAAALREAKRAMLARLLAAEDVGGPLDAIVRRAPGVAPPLSHAQEVLWLLDRATPGMIAYNSTLAFRLHGPLDAGALRSALDALVARHESLRTRFVARGDGAVQMVDEPGLVQLIVEDVRTLEADVRDAAADACLRAEARHAFDLANEHMFRAMLVRRSNDDFTLMLLTHHIVSDAWSYGVMVREISALYAAAVARTAASLTEPAIQFGDYAAWERISLAGGALAEKLGYWRENLTPVAPALVIPSDRPRSLLPAFDGGRALRLVSRDLADALKALAQGEGATLYMVLLAAFQSLLHRIAEQDDLVTGSAIAGRTRSETEHVIGYFSAALPLRTRFVAGESFRTLLGRVRRTVLDALAHQEVPAEALMQELAAGGRAGNASLFQAVLTMQQNQGVRLELPGIMVCPEEVAAGTTKFDITLLPKDAREHLELLLWYRTDILDQSSADRFLGHYATMLGAIAANPDALVDALPFHTPGETATLAGWNDTARDLGAETTMLALIEAAGSRRGDSVAVVSGNAMLSWADLLARAHQLAHHLRALGVGPDVPVGLCLDTNTDLLVALVGIFAAGGAYVPVLPDQPAPRIATQLAECGTRLVVTMSQHRRLLPEDAVVVALDTDAEMLAEMPTSSPESDITARNLAYVLYTSGSTGTPKGVAITHGNLVHYTRAIASVLGVSLDGERHAWRFASVSTLAADLGHTSVFPSLASGGELHVLARDVVTDAPRFQSYMAANSVDVLKITPSHFQALASPEMRGTHWPAKWLVIGGEACTWDVADQATRAAPCRVLNHYGPTETTVGACTYEIVRGAARAASATVPIGRPLPNVTAHVLDRTAQPMPVGAPGELYIGGAGVARGYRHRDDLTAERFVIVGGERVYRTGDRVRRLASGDLEFLGRLDSQVKVRGYRVELGEIETVLAQHPSVRQAVVVMHDGALVGYLAVNSSMPVDDAEMAAHAGAFLPDYMIPAAWMRLDDFPLNANGKVDRTALPAPMAAGTQSGGEPTTEAERQMAALWSDVLKKDRVRVNENFFALGGHSLLAIRLLGKIAKVFGRRLTLRTLFENPTVSALAAVVTAPAEAAMGS